jgi:pimeloyl-ACP methyl ester carboxylesterase
VDDVDQLMQHEYSGHKFILVTDDSGSGIASHDAAAHNDRLNALIQLNAITFDGYPVNEIQAIGQASQIPNAGHFAHTDRPLFVADTIVNFIRHVMGRSAMADINTRP